MLGVFLTSNAPADLQKMMKLLLVHRFGDPTGVHKYESTIMPCDIDNTLKTCFDFLQILVKNELVYTSNQCQPVTKVLFDCAQVHAFPPWGQGG